MRFRALGERNGAAKLTADKVRWIRRVHVPSSHRYGTSALARCLGVRRDTVEKVLQGVNWSHVDG